MARNEQPIETELKLDVNVRVIEPMKNLLGFAKVTINDCFVVNDIKVCTGEKGMFIGMPSVPDARGGYKDICLPITSEFHQKLTDAVLDGYDDAIAAMQDKLQAAENTVRKPANRQETETAAYKPERQSLNRRVREAEKQVRQYTPNRTARTNNRQSAEIS